MLPLLPVLPLLPMLLRLPLLLRARQAEVSDLRAKKDASLIHIGPDLEGSKVSTSAAYYIPIVCQCSQAWLNGAAAGSWKQQDVYAAHRAGP